MTIQHVVEHIPSGVAVKISGVLGGSTALAGVATDLSAYSQVAQDLANVGIFIGSMVALVTLIISLRKGKKK